MKQTPEQVLKGVFGYDEFRPPQREVIQNVLDGKDTLAVMPTGGGKSLCYQIPAVLFSGLTVVVSPLIALMQDQVEQLDAVGIPAVYLNSSLEWGDYTLACSKIHSGKIKLLYVSPEGLATERVQGLLKTARVHVDCITIDEAHCVSEWGHDFRPDYLQIAALRELFPDAVCLALTATATKRVRADIVSALSLRNPAVLVASFNRPNIFLEVQRKSSATKQVIAFIKEHKDESGIVYCFSRREVDDLTEDLQDAGFSALNYHAGLSDAERAEHQTAFIKDKVQVMVATVAFGMGINKPDVRFVIHYGLPKSIEQYYQEIGRAGRDGLPSHALLLYSYADASKIRYFFADSADPQTAERLLSGMVRYAECRTCRRRYLLSYFGEVLEMQKEPAAAEKCCDSCVRGPLPEKDVTIPSQKFMSCVIRTGQHFGAQYITDVLLGSKGERILLNRHDKLSTYGIGRELDRSGWLELSCCLVEEGYMEKEAEHSTLRLTDFGMEALRKRAVIRLPIDFRAKRAVQSFPKPAKAYSSLSAGDTAGERIAKALKEWRRKTADRLNVAPYIVFGDKTLLDIAAKKPVTRGALSACYGIGDRKIETFGDDVIKIVRSGQNSLSESKK